MGRCIMVIDDSDTDLLFTQLLLKRAASDMEVVCHESAQDALQVLSQPGHNVVLILLDINMPGMNGFEFLAAYERLDPVQQARAVVVMLSSSPLDADRQRALSFSTVKGYMVKPLDVKAAAALRQYLPPDA